MPNAIDHLTDHILQFLFEDDTFCETYCRDCPAIRRYPGDYCNPPEEHCPVDFDVAGKGCRRYRDWRKIEGLADEIATIALPESKEEY